MTYNGWSNYETWNINLWLNNEEPLYHAKTSFIHTNLALAPFDQRTARVREFCFEIFPDGTPDMDHVSDMAKVNYDELAENWLIDYED